MPIQDLPDTPTALPDGGVRSLLRDLGSEDEHGGAPWPWTGRIHLDDPATARSADLWLFDGTVYAAHMQGYIPPVALRLRSAGCLDDFAYDEAAAMDPAETGPWAVEHGYAPAPVVEAIHREVMLATVSHLYEWEYASWYWIEDEQTGDYVTTGVPLMLVASAVDERIGQWRAVTRGHPHVVQPTAIPQPGPSWAEKTGAEVAPELASLLACVDGRSNIAQIASACGFTRFESARLLSQAAAEGMLVFTLAPPPPAPMPVTEPVAVYEPMAEMDLEMMPVLGAAPAPDASLPTDARGVLEAAAERIRQAQDALADAAQQVADALSRLEPAPQQPEMLPFEPLIAAAEQADEPF